MQKVKRITTQLYSTGRRSDAAAAGEEGWNSTISAVHQGSCNYQESLLGLVLGAWLVAGDNRANCRGQGSVCVACLEKGMLLEVGVGKRGVGSNSYGGGLEQHNA